MAVSKRFSRNYFRIFYASALAFRACDVISINFSAVGSNFKFMQAFNAFEFHDKKKN
jgi:hypothetical protein